MKTVPVESAARATLESQEIYEAAQAYRHAPIIDPRAVIAAYENLKAVIAASERSRVIADLAQKMDGLAEQYADGGASGVAYQWKRVAAWLREQDSGIKGEVK